MNVEQFKALYEKFVEGLCSPEEIDLLMSYKDRFDFIDEIQDKVITAEDGSVKAEAFKKILDTIGGKKRIHRLNIWWYAAAMLIVTLGSTWFLMKREIVLPVHLKNISLAKVQLRNPGSSSVTLTIGGNAAITLDDVKNGLVSNSGGAFIKKVTNGKLVYSPGHNHTPAVRNIIAVPRGNQYQLTLPDGTLVWLNAETTLSFPSRFTGTERNVTLKGEAYFEVVKNKQMPFKVNANQTAVEVFGTHFNVSAYPDNKEVKTTLLEGSVKVSNNKIAAFIAPGQQGILSENSTGINVTQAKLDEVMAWKHGYFIFHDESIVNVMKQVSRWYDVDVEYRGNVKNNEFGGSISKYKDIHELLHIMELTHTIHYKIEGRRVIIME